MTDEPDVQDLAALGITPRRGGLTPSTMITSFRAIATPAPQSGMRTVSTAAGPRQITTGGIGLPAFRQALKTEAAVAAVTVGCQEGALGLDVTFRFRLPESRPKWEREAAALPEGLPMIVYPDIDKLERAVLDGLVEGGLIRDDRLICSVVKRKVEVWDSWVGAAIVLNRVRRERGAA